MKKIKVIQDPTKEVPTEVLAGAIKDISAGIRKLRNGSLNEKALLLLIQHSAPTQANSARIPMTVISDVLDGIEGLEKQYIRKASK